MDVMTSMSVFRRVAEAESFSAVARSTGMSQSTVSKHVASLETRLGTKLLNRTTRHLALTESGSDYLGYCIRILDELSEAEATIGQGQTNPSGTLRITSTAPFGRMFIVPFLWQFLESYADLEIDLLLEDRYVDLVKEGVDVAIRVGPLEDSCMVARKIGVSRRVMVASPKYVEQQGEPKTLEALSEHQCLLYSLQKAPATWKFENKGETHSVRVSGRLRITNPDVIGDATLAGIGISTMCYWAVEEAINDGRLKIILPDYVPIPFEVNAVYPQRQFVPKKVQLLIEHLRQSFSENG